MATTTASLIGWVPEGADSPLRHLTDSIPIQSEIPILAEISKSQKSDRVKKFATVILSDILLKQRPGIFEDANVP